MRYTFLFFLLLSTSSFAQDLEALTEKNGFKNLKLGSSIDTLKTCSRKGDEVYRNEFPITIYDYANSNYERLGDVPIYSVRLWTYQNRIVEIHVTTRLDEKIMRAIEKQYGKGKYAVRTEGWYWNSSGVVLAYFGKPSKKQIELRYVSKAMIKKMYQDKGQAVEDLANDF